MNTLGLKELLQRRHFLLQTEIKESELQSRWVPEGK